VEDPKPFELEYGTGYTRVHRFDLPTFIALLLVFGMFSVVEVFIIPGFEGIFKDAHAELPGFTKIAIQSSEWFKNGAWGVLVVLAILLPILVAMVRRGAPPTKRSARLAVRLCIFFFTLVVGYFVVAIGVPVITMTTSLPTH
jgi:type II secretory pathway component PulF